MDPYSESDLPAPHEFVPKKRSFWQKLGGGSLSISLILHAFLLAAGVFWILQIIPPEAEKKVDFMPKSGGGGSPASQAKSQQHQVKMVQPNLARVSAVGAASSIVLPEPDPSSQMSSMSSLSAGGLSAGLGGNGGGGGRGDGQGPGIGGGLAPGLSDGTGAKNPFGMASVGQGALVGSFYDLKQTNSRQPTGMTDDGFREELKQITKRGFKESAFRKYYKAPRELFQTKLHIPIIDADAAPTAFECEKEVQPKRWIVVYRGSVQAPLTGKFRFVGAADDVLCVRFNNRDVFDYGYTMATTGKNIIGKSDELADPKNKSDLAREIRRDSPMPIPITYYKYSSGGQTNRNIGGMAVGPEFEVEAGKAYPVEILVSEIPGGHFSVSLLIEQIGATYQKDPAGFPILPLFRLDNTPPARVRGDAPPFDPNGPVWKSAADVLKKDI